MNDVNFDKLYSDFQNFFTLCHYTDDALKKEVLDRAHQEKDRNNFNFYFRGIVFKFEINNKDIKYVGYEK
ncbi:hypothetical protein ACFPDQ_06125 [Pseudofrancisella aestuarii]|uniref:Uncharacterized protein n=1 Tax=Pseudofrancisella aestuarii TaxID=2670347 RepID=A0ABV9TCC1_9GAMM|nr:hypothetical protein [Pseudofrancisella aestuarii]